VKSFSFSRDPRWVVGWWASAWKAFDRRVGESREKEGRRFLRTPVDGGLRVSFKGAEIPWEKRYI